MADGDALHVTRTKAFSAVGVQKTLEKRLSQSLFQCLYGRTEKGFSLFQCTGSTAKTAFLLALRRTPGNTKGWKPDAVFQPLQTQEIT
jgi:hypothetical protein